MLNIAELILLKDSEPVTAEWAIDQLNAEYHEYDKSYSFNIDDTYDLLVEEDGSVELWWSRKVGSVFLPSSVKNRGQLRCLIIGLGGEW